MSHESIAVITTVLNERDGIQVLLDGFLAQTRVPDEIVVVDGGSTDGTIDVLQRYAQAHPIVKLCVEPGANIARGRNIAIRRSSASIVAVTDGGCRPNKDWLEELTKPLLQNPDFGAVTGTRQITPANRFERFAGLLSTSGNAAEETSRVFHGRNSAFRKSVWQSAGGYPEWLYTAEDTLFAHRAKALGCRVALAASAIVSWRPRPNLRKLAKQYFLYGRGTGRIGMADRPAALYHLRNHAIWMLSLLLSPFAPWLALVAVLVLAYVLRMLVPPALKLVRDAGATPSAWFYVPLIVSLRSISNNMGQLYGDWEYRHADGFRRNLECYQSGTWKMEDGRSVG